MDNVHDRFRVKKERWWIKLIRILVTWRLGLDDPRSALREHYQKQARKEKWANRVRALILWSTRWTRWNKGLVRRTQFTEVGFTGHVVDKDIAEDEGLKPLNRFEKWLLRPAIDYAKGFHQEAFRQACIEALGEDPNDW